MTKNNPLSKAIIEVGRRFDECELSEIQAAFGAAVATTNNKRKREAFQILLGYAEQAKTSGDPEALGNLAATFGAAGHPDIATPMLEKACRTDKNGSLFCRLHNRFNLGRLYSKTDRLPEALATYEEAVEIWNNRLNIRDSFMFLKCFMDQAANSKLYDALLRATYVGIFYTAGTIALNFLEAGDQAAAEPYLVKAEEHKKYLSIPPGGVFGGPTLD